MGGSGGAPVACDPATEFGSTCDQVFIDAGNCQDCSNKNCCAPINSCLADQSCRDLLGCYLARCDNLGLPCVDQKCSACSSPKPQFQPIYECWASQCPTECYWLLQQ